MIIASLAHALDLRVRAEVAADFQTIRGSIESDAAVTYVDLLSRIPVPEGDLQRGRVFPGPVDGGKVTWNCDGLRCTFESHVPRRNGDIGAKPGEGLWANGAWYPVVEGAPAARWDVELTLPAGALGVANGAVATDQLRWRGEADRVAIAALPGPDTLPARIAVGSAGRASALGRPAQRPVVEREIGRIIGERRPFDAPLDVVIVSTPHRQRLATAGPGVVYLSDRAFRLSPGLHRFHWAAVRRAIYSATAPFTGTWDREFAATAMAQGAPTPSVKKSLGWAAWNPIIDAILTDGTLPFYEDVFDKAYPVATDPYLFGRRDPRAAALQLDDAAPDRPGAADLVMLARREGIGIVEAGERVGELARVVAAWRLPEDPDQDYAVVRAGPAAQVERRGGSATEIVVMEHEDDATWSPMEPGDKHPVGAEARALAVDPEGHVLDANRGNNRWPARWSLVATGWIDDISPSQESFEAWGNLVFRRQDDSRNLFVAGLSHDARDLVSGSLGYLHHFGPLVNRRARQHRIYLLAGPTLFDPSYQDVATGQVAMEGGVVYAWDTRVTDIYATEGQRLAFAIGGGTVLDGDDTWASASATAVGLLPLHPRHVLAGRLKGGWSSSDVPHRLLSLGGADALRSLGDGEGLGNERALASLEYRWAPLRDASVPLGLAWLSQLQLVPGLEAGATRAREEDVTSALGATLGLYVVADVFGARPTLVGAVGAIPLWRQAVPSSGPQVYVSFDHAF